MTSSPEFIINPVLRQARRLSANFATSGPLPARARETSSSDEASASAVDEDDVSVAGPGDPSAAALPSPVAPAGAHRRGLSTASSFEPASDGTPHNSPPTRPTTAGTSPGWSEPIAAEAADGSAAHGTVAPAPAHRKMELPEDDGMRTMRRRIIDIQARGISSDEKARQMHGLLMEGYTRSQIARRGKLLRRSGSPPSPAAPGTPDSFRLWPAEPPSGHTVAATADDAQPTYVPPRAEADDGEPGEARVLGCEHYRRNVKLQCSTCRRWYTCRLCHNDSEDHVLPRRETKNMLCMLCGHVQRVGEICVRCGVSAARYYCNICKLWNDDPDKSIYHCGDCGICRVGEGLGKDFVHCKKCGSCIAITMEDSHKCREGAMDCDCPICGEYMFTSPKVVVSMKCGHMIHKSCRAEHIKTSFRCPICNKSIENMESQFRRLDKHLQEQPMPPEYEHTRAIILCNDCEAKTSTRYHWGGLKCEVCLSYNTVELHVLGSPLLARNGTPVARSGREVEGQGAVLALPPAAAATAARELPHRGHRPRASLGSRLELRATPTAVVPARLARSVSPPAPAGASTEQAAVVADESDQEDMFDFWSRDERRRTASAESAGPGHREAEDEDAEDESDSDAVDEADEDDDDDDDEEIVLFGHR